MVPTPHHHPIAGLGDGGSISSSILFLLSLHPLTPRCAAHAPSPQPVIVQANTANFAPTLSTVVIILFAVFSILGLLTLYIRQWVISSERRAAAFAEAEGSPSLQPQDGATGLSAEMFGAFPTMTYLEAKALKMGMGALECAVCICEFEDEETLRVLPGCCHVFHPDCIDAWLASHITCPVCRCDLAAAADAVAAAADDHGPTPDNDYPAPPVDVENTPPEHVVVVEAEPTSVEDAVGLTRNESGERRQTPVVLARSPSSGHSPQPARAVEDVDRYTLVLPEHVRRQIFAARQLHRSASCAVFPTANIAAAEGEVSLRPGGKSRRGWGSWLGWSERWSASFLRTLSVTFPPWRRSDSREGSTMKGEAEDPSTGRLAAVKNSFDRLIGIGGDASGGGRGNNNDNTVSVGN